MTKNKIEILIPTYNEGNNIGRVLKELNQNGYYNITILDANSSDKTVDVAKKYNCKIILDGKNISGFGGSVINGLKNLTSEFFCIFDGDGSFNPSDLKFMIEKIDQGYDFVFASRYVDNAVSDDDTIITKIGNYFFTKIVSIFFKIPTTDLLFLYVLGRSSKVSKLNLNNKDFSICSEFLIKSYKMFKCTEVFSKERKRISGFSKVNKFFDGLIILKDIFKMYFKRYF